jgi:hypothetical protein
MTPHSIHARHRRHLLLALSALAAGCAAPGWTNDPTRATPRLRLLGEQRLPHRLAFRDTTVGGLSAIDYDPATGLYDLLSDDRSDLHPARLYRARLPVSANGLGTPELVDVITLRQLDGQPWPARPRATPGVEVVDPEGVRRLPDGNLLWTSEGDPRRGFGPSLRVAAPDGRLLRELPLPPHFALPSGGAAPATQGPRENLTFEGLTLTPDGRQAWVGMENALVQDGPIPRVGEAGGPCRFTRFDLATGRAVGQIAYVPDAIPRAPTPANGFADNGVSEILAQDEHHLLVLERAFVQGFGNSLRLYRIDTRAGTDTLALDRLTPDNHRAAPKTLVLDFATLGLPRLDNSEGLTWGPRLADGRRSLIVVSDDNFNSAQITQFLAFAVDE